MSNNGVKLIGMSNTKQEWRDIVVKALAKYGASLSSNDCIQRHGAVTGTKVTSNGKRLCFGTERHLFATTPLTEKGVASFVEKFWYWKPLPESQP